MKFKTLLTLLLLFLFIAACQDGESIDPCQNITCLNDGVCLNGQCSCPDEYEGPACEQKKKPTAIKIISITINSFPSTKSNGDPWDVFSAGPDIYWEYYKDGQLNDRLDVSERKENAVNDVPFGFNLNFRITDQMTTIRSFYIMDYDSTSDDDQVGFFTFLPFDEFANNTFERVKTYERAGASFTLVFEYEF